RDNTVRVVSSAMEASRITVERRQKALEGHLVGVCKGHGGGFLVTHCPGDDRNGEPPADEVNKPVRQVPHIVGDEGNVMGEHGKVPLERRLVLSLGSEAEGNGPGVTGHVSYKVV